MEGDSSKKKNESTTRIWETTIRVQHRAEYDTILL